MSAFELSQRAIHDLDAILVYRTENAGSSSAAQLEEEILAACERLAQTPGLGHRRSDLTALPYFFYPQLPYLIVYARQTEPLAIVAILHSSRDVRKTLRDRFRIPKIV